MHRLTGLTVLALCLGCNDGDDPKSTTDAGTHTPTDTTQTTDTDTTDTTDTGTETTDADGDGVPAADDCDDANDAVHPGATEVCNGTDDDCDGLIDDDDDDLDASTGEEWAPDVDSDGFPDETAPTVFACVAPVDHIALRTDGLRDCDDANDAVHPDATEICNDADDDCDSLIDDDDDDLDASSGEEWAPDLDGDGFPAETDPPLFACVAPPDHIAPRLDGLRDCDDLAVNAYPGNVDDPPYDGLDGDCAGDNDFDPDGDGYMPPNLPGGAPTEPAYDSYVARYDLDLTLPAVVTASAPGAAELLELGAFDDCLDLLDPRVGADLLDAADIHPRAWSETFGDSGDIPYDGIDTDCNRDNDFDQDRDGYLPEDYDDVAYDEYILYWGYQTDRQSWGEGGLSAPAPGDCDDTDAGVHPNAPARPGTPATDVDCDGVEDLAFVSYEGFPTAEVMEWKGLGVPNVIRVGNVYGVILGAQELVIPSDLSPQYQNVGVALPFHVVHANQDAAPSVHPYFWKGQSAVQDLGPAMDAISLDRCPGADGEDIAFVTIEYATIGAPSLFFSAYPLQVSPTGMGLTVPGLDTIGSAGGAEFSQAVSLNMDGLCQPILASVRDEDIFVSHGEGLVVDLAMLEDDSLTGRTIAATFDPVDATGAAPFVSFEVCEVGSCSEYTFDLDPTTTADPVLSSTVLGGGPYAFTRSSWSRTEDAMTVAVPEFATGLELHARPLNAPDLFETVLTDDVVLSAHGQFHDGVLYAAAVVEGGNVLLVWGVPGAMETYELDWTTRLPAQASFAEPKDVALLVDDDRIAIALTLEDQGAGPLDNTDAVGWMFLGLPD